MGRPLAALVAVRLALALALAGGSELQREGRARNHGHNVCSTWGDFHYKTFDGDVFRFPGLCDYNFASDCRDAYKEFAVHLKRGLGEGGGPPRVESVLLTIKDDTIYLTHQLAVVNGAMVSTPHYSSGLLIEKNDAYTKVYSRAGLVLMWNREDAVMLELDGRFRNHTCGLCGDYNGLQTYSEFLSEGISFSALEFGNLQKINKPGVECDDPGEAPAPEACSEHRAECERLLTASAFEDCQARVPVELYVRACEQDRCRCPPGGACECSTVAEFSRQCSHAGGRPGSWRTASLCPKSCPGNMVYLESGSPCMDTCSHLEVSSLCEEHRMDGCFCPEGTVYDDITGGGCVPVSQCHCRLHGHLYMPGQEVSNDCEQCTCRAGRWVCEDLPCPGTCALEGGAHISTFDGKKFTFHGDCYYVLTKGDHNDSFALLGELAPCGSTDKQTCLKTVVLLMDKNKNVVAFKSDGSVLLNELEVTLPHVAASFAVFQPSSYHIVVNTVFGLRLQVQLVPVMQLFVTLDQASQGQVQGLCGNFNGLESDDFMTSGGLVEATGAGFANTWKAQTSCHDKLDWLDDPCSLNIESANYAEHWCSLLRRAETPFGKCHLAVDPTEYYKRCKYDTCNCQNNEDCLCAALSSYARACAAKGVMLWGWRERVCNKDVGSCPNSQVFLYNLTTCQQTCRSLSEGDTHCLKGFAPVDGCGCPDHTFLDEKGRCVPLAKCSCYHHGLYLEAGEVILRQEERCVCQNGRLNCRRVKLLSQSCKAPKILVDCSNLTALATQNPRPRSCQALVAGYYHMECVSGCVCPNGLLDDGRGGCVVEEECPCVHNKDLYLPGDRISLDCNNTCVCQKGRWACTEYACHGTCSIYGSGHFITFDGKHYDFDGHCSYVAVQDYCGQNSSGGSFSIVTENVPCGTTGVTCSKAIKIFIGGTELKLEDGHRVVKQLEEGHHVPYITREVGQYLVVEASTGIIVIWDKKTTLFIRLAPSYKGTVCGLCGNFDDRTSNDFTTRDHMVVSGELDFGNSWKEASTCPDVSGTPDPCSANPHRRSWAEKQCSIIKSRVFRGCHSKVDPTVFYEACVHDSCSCDTGGDCECFCSAVASYAQECTKAEACVFWRTPDLCPIFCDYYNPPDECEWHYEPCGNRSFETCRTINGIHSNISVSHLEGCYPRCPRERPIYDEDQKKCVTGDQCGCYIEDTHYPPGAPIPSEDICTSCMCSTSSQITCQIDEDKVVNVTQDGVFCYWDICGPNGTVEHRFNICSSSTTPPSTTPTSAITTSFTTPTPLSTTTTPTATATPSAAPSTPADWCCYWSNWINEDHPKTGIDGGDHETFKGVCMAPEDIECRSAAEPHLNWTELKQKVQCNVTHGLACENEDQLEGVGLWDLCYDYEIRVKCCLPWHLCFSTTSPTTTTPTTTTTTTTTTTSTTTPTSTPPTSTTPTPTPTTPPTSTSTTSPTPTTTTPPTPTSTTPPTSASTSSPTSTSTTPPISTSTISPTPTPTTPPTSTTTTSPTPTPTTPSTSTSTTSPPPTSSTPQTTSPTPTPTTPSTSTSSSSPTPTPSTPPTSTSTTSPIPTTLPTSTSTTSPTPTTTTPPTSTSTSTSPTPIPTTPPTTCPCLWTGWWDSGKLYPNKTGDFELVGSVCGGLALDISCRAVEYPSTPIEQLGQRVVCDPSIGLVCKNEDQKGSEIFPVPICLNYEINVYCCDCGVGTSTTTRMPTSTSSTLSTPTPTTPPTSTTTSPTSSPTTPPSSTLTTPTPTPTTTTSSTSSSSPPSVPTTPPTTTSTTPTPISTTPPTSTSTTSPTPTSSTPPTSTSTISPTPTPTTPPTSTSTTSPTPATTTPPTSTSTTSPTPTPTTLPTSTSTTSPTPGTTTPPTSTSTTSSTPTPTTPPTSTSRTSPTPTPTTPPTSTSTTSPTPATTTPPTSTSTTSPTPATTTPQTSTSSTSPTPISTTPPTSTSTTSPTPTPTTPPTSTSTISPTPTPTTPPPSTSSTSPTPATTTPQTSTSSTSPTPISTTSPTSTSTSPTRTPTTLPTSTSTTSPTPGTTTPPTSTSTTPTPMSTTPTTSTSTTSPTPKTTTPPPSTSPTSPTPTPTTLPTSTSTTSPTPGTTTPPTSTISATLTPTTPPTSTSTTSPIPMSTTPPTSTSATSPTPATTTPQTSTSSTSPTPISTTPPTSTMSPTPTPTTPPTSTSTTSPTPTPTTPPPSTSSTSPTPATTTPPSSTSTSPTPTPTTPPTSTSTTSPTPTPTTPPTSTSTTSPTPTPNIPPTSTSTTSPTPMSTTPSTSTSTISPTPISTTSPTSTSATSPTPTPTTLPTSTSTTSPTPGTTTPPTSTSTTSPTPTTTTPSTSTSTTSPTPTPTTPPPSTSSTSPTPATTTPPTSTSTTSPTPTPTTPPTSTSTTSPTPATTTPPTSTSTTSPTPTPTTPPTSTSSTSPTPGTTTPPPSTSTTSPTPTPTTPPPSTSSTSPTPATTTPPTSTSTSPTPGTTTPPPSTSTTSPTATPTTPPPSTSSTSPTPATTTPPTSTSTTSPTPTPTTPPTSTSTTSPTPTPTTPPTSTSTTSPTPTPTTPPPSTSSTSPTPATTTPPTSTSTSPTPGTTTPPPSTSTTSPTATPTTPPPSTSSTSPTPATTTPPTSTSTTSPTPTPTTPPTSTSTTSPTPTPNIPPTSTSTTSPTPMSTTPSTSTSTISPTPISTTSPTSTSATSPTPTPTTLPTSTSTTSPTPGTTTSPTSTSTTSPTPTPTTPSTSTSTTSPTPTPTTPPPSTSSTSPTPATTTLPPSTSATSPTPTPTTPPPSTSSTSPTPATTTPPTSTSTSPTPGTTTPPPSTSTTSPTATPTTPPPSTSSTSPTPATTTPPTSTSTTSPTPTPTTPPTSTSTTSPTPTPNIPPTSTSTTSPTPTPTTPPTSTSTTSPTPTPNIPPTSTSTTSPTPTTTTPPPSTSTTSPTPTTTTPPPSTSSTSPTPATTTPPTSTSTSPTPTPTTPPTSTSSISPTPATTTTPPSTSTTSSKPATTTPQTSISTTSPTPSSSTPPTSTSTTPTPTSTSLPTSTPTTSPTPMSTTPTSTSPPSPTPTPTTTPTSTSTTSPTTTSSTPPTTSPTPASSTPPTSTTSPTATTTTPQTSTSTTTSPTPAPTTPPTTCPCLWTGWWDSGKLYPNKTGDFELVGSVCGGLALDISCRAVEYPSTPIEQLGQRVVCDPSIGLVCKNEDQKGSEIFPVPICLNYEINVYCCDCDVVTSTTTRMPTSTSSTLSTPTPTTPPTSTTTSPTSSPTTPPSSTLTTPTPTPTTTTSSTSSSSPPSVPTTPPTTTSTTPTPISTTPPTSTSTTSPTPTSSTPQTSTSTTSPTPATTTPTSTSTTSPTPTPTTPPTSTSTTSSTPGTTTPPTSTSTTSPTPTPTITPTSTSTTFSTRTPTTSGITSTAPSSTTRGTPTPASTTPKPTTPTSTITTATTTGTPFSSETTPTGGTTTELSSPTTRSTSTPSSAPPTAPPSTPTTPTRTPLSSTTPTTPRTTSTSVSWGSTASVSPLTSPSTWWTSSATQITCCVLNDTFYGPGEVISNHTSGGNCYQANCTIDCQVLTTTWPCPSTPSPPSTPPSPTPPTTTPSTTTSTSQGPPPDCPDFDPPRQVNETWWLCECYMATCKYNNTVEIEKVECDPPPKPTCSNGLPPVRVEDPDGCCWHWECDCYCTGWGDPHYMTFDGLYYSYQGNCTYVLVEEVSPTVDNFGVYIDNYHCDANDKVSCPRTLIVRHETQEVLVKTVQMAPIKMQVQVNKQAVALPYKKYGVEVYESGINFMVNISRLGALISYNGLSFSIRLPYRLFGNNTKGQCGTCTNNTADDCVLPSGEVVSDCELAADQWVVDDPSKPHCPHAGSTTQRPSTTAAGLRKTTRPQDCPGSPLCQLIKDSLFSPCHAVVPPQHYYDACVFDSCFVPDGGLECASVQIYAALCAQEGVCIDWRNHTHGACPMTCPPHREYRACGPTEEPTCKSSPAPEDSERLVEGCFCPEGTVNYAPGFDVCVNTCGCMGPDNVPREFGERFTFDCKDCVCLEGGSGIICQPRVCAQKGPSRCTEDGTYLVTEIDPADPCCSTSSCKCNTSLCQEEPPSCLLGFEVKRRTVPGRCCPVYSCEPKGVCVHQNAEYQPGSPVYSSKCEDCVCTHAKDNNTRFNVITCTHVPCNSSCSPGFDLVDVPGECCKKCQQTQCVVERPNGQFLILEPGETRENLDDKCTYFTCTKINSQLTSFVSRIMCPEFDESSCVPGSVTFMPNGCCKTCIPRNQTRAPCSTLRVTKEISHDGCARNVSMNYCSGSCGTSAMYSAQAQSLDHQCSCCKEGRTSQREVSLDCPDGGSLRYTYTHIESCRCQDTVCELPRAPRSRARRASPRLPGGN